MYLHLLPSNKKNVPLMIPDPISVVKDIRAIVLKHKDDCPKQAVTSKYLLRWSENDDDNDELKRGRKAIITSTSMSGGKESSSSSNRRREGGGASAHAKVFKKTAAGNRRRRVRCKICQACLGGDCQQCVYCKDMIKYGGPGRMKQTCEKVIIIFSYWRTFYPLKELE